jgi:hypothetical protein
VKRKLFIKELVAQGCVLKRHGSRHDIYFNAQNGRMMPIPRHPEIKRNAVSTHQKAAWIKITGFFPFFYSVIMH